VILVVGSLVGIVLVVVVIRLVMLLMASRRRSRDEEAARRAAQANEGPSRGHLLVREGPCAGQTFHLVGEVTYMGRSPDNHVSLSDGSVGKRHCSITIKDRSFQVEDLQSVNGVFLNGQRVLKAFLKDGDSIRLGSSEMQFRL
jgi:pSer/pThr/pTyr-binding forkhead associated (FHA) protein